MTIEDGIFEVTVTAGDAHLEDTEDFDNQIVDVRMQDSKGKNRGEDLAGHILPCAMLELSVNEPSAPCLFPRRRRERSMLCLMALLFPGVSEGLVQGAKRGLPPHFQGDR